MRATSSRALSKLSAALGIAGLVLCAIANDEPRVAKDNGEEHSREMSLFKLSLMIRSGSFTPDQVNYARQLLDQRTSMITLFTKYGLLSEAQLAEKLAEILEVTDYEFLKLLDADQAAMWSHWRLRSPSAGSSSTRMLRHRAMIRECEKTIEDFSRRSH